MFSGFVSGSVTRHDASARACAHGGFYVSSRTGGALMTTTAHAEEHTSKSAPRTLTRIQSSGRQGPNAAIRPPLALTLLDLPAPITDGFVAPAHRPSLSTNRVASDSASRHTGPARSGKIITST